MPSFTSTAAMAALVLQTVSAATDTFNFCTESKCSKCPVQLGSRGTGFPKCVVYQSKNIFPGQGFSGSKGGGHKVYLDVAQPDKDCQIIVRSPADTTKLACGTFKASFSHAACAMMDLDKTFMVQYCCGKKCVDAGIGDDDGDNSKLRYVRALDARGAGGLYLHDANGTVIEPDEVADIPTAVPRAIEERKKKGKCDGDWKQTDHYTRPANNVQIVLDEATGPGQVKIETTRSQSWTQSSGMNLGVADILSLGASITQEETEEKSDNTGYTFNLEEGQSGSIGFTSTLKCTVGSGTCSGKTVKGEICWPIYNKKTKHLKGTTSVITHD
ncbi:uncharacterized protein E0L32_011268 [Thyridium curvatum]|uniref:Uncharacterized protein n=1 Tax=Thyridium curvatum TaxID=1093900 RepID=A0A507BJK5_9PEZI|nr:uncharacterized protein E0L32_011268 [Thyridium curvatum]TPX19024.1 hypothetical protein E0L32_011268 [Thyridium curvatum]